VNSVGAPEWDGTAQASLRSSHQKTQKYMSNQLKSRWSKSTRQLLHQRRSTGCTRLAPCCARAVKFSCNTDIMVRGHDKATKCVQSATIIDDIKQAHRFPSKQKCVRSATLACYVASTCLTRGPLLYNNGVCLQPLPQPGMQGSAVSACFPARVPLAHMRHTTFSSLAFRCSPRELAMFWPFDKSWLKLNLASPSTYSMRAKRSCVQFSRGWHFWSCVCKLCR
jgi:hypothetical protein